MLAESPCLLDNSKWDFGQLQMGFHKACLYKALHHVNSFFLCELWISSAHSATLDHVVASLTNALHKQSLIIGGWPPLGTVVVVPYSFHFD